MIEIKKTLPLVESFYTLQGEGHNTGRATYFIRLAGCNVRCSWCDAKNTWNEAKYPQVDIKDIVAEAAKHPAKTVVITGGEPFLHDLTPLCKELHKQNFEILIETSGSAPYSGEFDWICVSPKRKLPPTEEMCKKASELKVVISTEDDFQWADQHSKMTSPGCILYLQPEWDKSQTILPKIVEYIKEHPQWRISLQTHKFMNIP